MTKYTVSLSPCIDIFQRIDLIEEFSLIFGQIANRFAYGAIGNRQRYPRLSVMEVLC